MNRGRRRFLTVLAGAPIFAWGAPSAALPRTETRSFEWTGTALGADASIRIVHRDVPVARRLVEACVGEIRRIETEFDLQSPASALSHLNRTGRLRSPSPAFLTLLRSSASLHGMTAGAFDPTVQSLWSLYAAHFAAPGSAIDGPSPEAISQARARVDFGTVIVAPESVHLTKCGTALTLNGIAQGYLTDRVARLLARAGVRSALVEAGETYGLGMHPDGRPWRIGIPDPVRAVLARTLLLGDRAVATSSPFGTTFEPSSRFHHLFDPRTGRCTDRYAAVTVAAPSATLADGLSTAFSAMTPREVAAIVAALPGLGAHLTTMDGRRIAFGAL